MRNYLKLGEWNAICDVCGTQYKSSQLIKRWDGLMVCYKDYETRHPSDLYRYSGHEEHIPWARPEVEDDFIDVSNFSEILTELGEPIVTETIEVALYTEG